VLLFYPGSGDGRPPPLTHINMCMYMYKICRRDCNCQ